MFPNTYRINTCLNLKINDRNVKIKVIIKAIDNKTFKLVTDPWLPHNAYLSGKI